VVAPIGPAGDAAESDDEVPRRERLRWEKELLGLYLSEHPLGEIADQLPLYVTAYTGDLAEESDQAKVTIGGIIQGTRRIITRAGSTMLVATVEDLQGSTEVVVFPKVFADTGNAWAEDSVVLVTGRVDHRDEGSQILCEAVHPWDDAVRLGPVAFSAERDRLLRARTPRGGWGNGSGSGGAQPPASSLATSLAPPAPDAPLVMPRGAAPAAASVAVGSQAASSASAPAAAPVPVGTPAAASVPSSVAPAVPVGPGPEADGADDAPAPSDAVPLGATPAAAGTISIDFEAGASMERLLPAIESVTQAVRNRPGDLPVVVSIPVAGATRQVRLPHRAEWDERLAEQVRHAAGIPVAVELRPTASDA
jgi:hypothetical protein